MRFNLAMLLSALAFVAVTGAGSAQTSDPLGKLGMWEGRWTFSGQIYQTPYSEGHSDTGIAECTWSVNHGYMICDYFSNDPPHDDLSMLNYSPAAKSYMQVSVHKDSPPSQSKVMQSGNNWITSRKTTDKGKSLVIMTRINFISADKQTTTVSVSADQGHTWTKMIEVKAVKVGAAG